MQPRVRAPCSVAEQNLELIASWRATVCGQTSHVGCDSWAGGWATGTEGVGPAVRAGVIMAHT